MARLRAAFARSPADRDLHTHIARATGAIRAAMDVCARASRGTRVSGETHYRVQQRRLSRAENLLNDIGHLEPGGDPSDLTQEARALCSWLESRERAQGIKRPSRRGQEYQDRLRHVLGFLGEISGGGEEDEAKPIVPIEAPKTEAAVPNYGMTDG